jgi:hypothetical protein
MSEFAVVHTDQTDSGIAGYALGLQIREAMITPPDVVLLFVAPSYDQSLVLHTLQETCQPRLLLGCSSAGEFTSKMRGVNLSCALAMRSEQMRFSIGIGHKLHSNGAAAANEMFASFPLPIADYPYQTALVLADALAGQLDTFLEHLTNLTHGTYQFVGGGSGDNAQFHWTPVFYGTRIITDAAVALIIQSKKPLGIGACHGWFPTSQLLQVTRSRGTYLMELDGQPAVEAFRQQAEAHDQHFDSDNPLPFFLHNLLGIAGSDGYTLRVPLSVRADGAIRCAAAIPEGARVALMEATLRSPIDAAIEATRQARLKLGSASPLGALFFDCVATRLAMGDTFGFELEAVQEQIEPVPYAGCNTHGQIFGRKGQKNNFHNCTAVVCLFPS